MRAFSTRDLDRPAAPLSVLAVAALVYGTLASIRYVYLACVLRLPEPGPDGVRRLITGVEYHLTSVVSLALAALLARELWSASRAPRGLRGGRAVGAALGAILAVSVFGLALIAHDPFSPPALPPNGFSPW